MSRPTTTNDAAPPIVPGAPPPGALDENGLPMNVPEAVRREFMEQLDGYIADFKAEMKRSLEQSGTPTVKTDKLDK